MKCTGCLKELEEEEKTYATVVGNKEKDSFSNQDDYGFYMSDIESWLSVLCEDCGMVKHKLIAKTDTDQRLMAILSNKILGFSHL